MGCAPCAGVDAIQATQPTKPRPLSISLLLNNLILRYKQLTSQPPHLDSTSALTPELKEHPILPLSQCSQLLNLLASGDTPALEAPSTTHPLLTPPQRCTWKCLLLLPEYLHQDSHILAQLPPFAACPVPQDQQTKLSFYQISLDVNRTYPQDSTLDRSQLQLVLQNVAMSMPGLGYTQGMNFYVGFLLLCGFTAQECYYVLAVLLLGREYLLASNFDNDFSQVINSNRLLAGSLSPKLAQHLQSLSIVEDIYSFSWFLCSFLYTLPVAICASIWDAMIKATAQGRPGAGFCYVVNVAVRIMDRMESVLLGVDNPEGIILGLKGEGIVKCVDGVELVKINKEIEEESGVGEAGSKGIRRRFVVREDLMKMSAVYKNVVMKKQAYQAYLDQLFGWSRKTKPKVEQELEHVGNPGQN